jgi:predicted aspartyl protease
MGITFMDIQVANPANPKKRRKVRLLVDSGAVYSIIPTQILRRLGIQPTATEEYILADGQGITRKRGNALFFLEGKDGASPVIFGEKGDGSLLGVVTLEALGKVFDPIRRELRPLKMILM